MANTQEPSFISISDFQDPDFNVNSWLNKVLAGVEEGSSSSALADRVNSISKSLEEQINITNHNLEEIVHKIIEQVPRVEHSVEINQNEIQRLHQDMSTGLADAEKVQRKTTAPMSNLDKLDNVRTKLGLRSKAIEDSDKWTKLEKQIEQYLDAGDVSKSYECILEMEKNKGQTTSETEERNLLLEEIKNRLEALATKHLILAFDTNNTENAHYFFTMFNNMERTKQFVKYFQNCEKIKLNQEWRKLVEIVSFKEAVVKYYDTLIDHWHAKLQWCRRIFSPEANVNPSNVLLDLYTETIRSLEPSFQFCFESEGKKLPFIELLIHFNQSTHRFANNMRQLVEVQAMSPDSTKVIAFMKALFEPFMSQYPKYSKYHESTVLSKIQVTNVSLKSQSTTTAGGGPSLQDKIESSKNLLSEIVLNIKEEEEKIGQFNHGFGYLHFGKGLNSGLERFVDWNQDIFKQLERAIDNYNSESERDMLENTLSFAETCGEILIQLKRLDQNLSTNCGKMFGKMTSSLDNTNPWEDLWGFYLDSNIRSEILHFVQKKETLLGKALNQMKKLCIDATQLVLRVTSEPIENQFRKNFQLQDSTLKEAIPSEYITQIGEYLMLLPQSLEPFITSENSSISFAFDQTTEEIGRSPIDFILSNLSTSISDAYVQRILKCTMMTNGQAKQLSQDIDYLSGVLEDIGLHISPDLLGILKLTKNYENLNDNTITERVPTRLVTAIRKMRTKSMYGSSGA